MWDTVVFSEVSYVTVPLDLGMTDMPQSLFFPKHPSNHNHSLGITIHLLPVQCLCALIPDIAEREDVEKDLKMPPIYERGGLVIGYKAPNGLRVLDLPPYIVLRSEI